LITSSNCINVNCSEEIVCPKLENAVTIDGRWTSNDEWNDAISEELRFVSNPGKVYFRIKHDDESLFLLIDYITLIKPQERDAAGIMIDTKNDGGDIMQKDDYFLGSIYMSEESPLTVRVWGTGDRILEDLSDLDWTLITKLDWELEPEGFFVSSTDNVENDPYSTDPHMIWEFKIPKSEFESETISFLTFVISLGRETGATYPLIEIDKLDNPDLWAKLKFINKTMAQIEDDKESTFTTTSAINITDLPKINSETSTTTITTHTATRTEDITVTSTTSEESGTKKLIEKTHVLYIIIGLLIVTIILLAILKLKRQPLKSRQ
jgi:hypothetical protein